MPLRLLVAGLHIECSFEAPDLEQTFRRAWEPACRLAENPAPSGSGFSNPSCVVRYRVDELGRLWKGGRLLSEQPHVIDRLGDIELDILRTVTKVWSRSVLLHAGCVAWRGRTFFFLGPSGAGKSTMTRELLRRGGTYLTDDLVVMDGARLCGIGRTVQFDALMEGEPIPSHLSDCTVDGYPVVDQRGRARYAPLWTDEHPVAASLAVDASQSVVCELTRANDNRVEALDSLSQLSALHAASLTSGACCSGELSGATGLSIHWSDPAEAIELAFQAIS